MRQMPHRTAKENDMAQVTPHGHRTLHEIEET